MSDGLLGWICRHSQPGQEHVTAFMADQFVLDGVAHNFSASAGAAVRKGIVKVLTEREIVSEVSEQFQAVLHSATCLATALLSRTQSLLALSAVGTR